MHYFFLSLHEHLKETGIRDFFQQGQNSFPNSCKGREVLSLDKTL